MIDQTKIFKNVLNTNIKLDLDQETKSLKETIAKLNNTFRDPNLLIEILREKQSQQKEIISQLNTSLVSMNEIKDDFLHHNSFYPNLTFDKSIFGSLELNPYQNDPFNSKILKGLKIH